MTNVRTSPPPAAPPLKKENVQGIFPTSPMQQALLVQSEGSREDDVGFVQVRCRIDGHLDPDRVQATWDFVFARHEALRMTVQPSKKQAKPLLIVHKRASPRVLNVDLRDAPAPEQANRIQTYCVEDRREGFALFEAPVARVTLFQLGPSHYHLVWSCHHALLDGWSAWVVLEEWRVAYRALAEGAGIDLAAAPRLSAYFQRLKASNDEAQAQFWSEKLNGFTKSAALKTIASTPNTNYGLETTTLSPAVVDSINQLARVCRATTSAVAYGAWALVLAAYTEARDLVFGSVVSGRPADLPGAEAMVGMFINTLPLRLQIDEGWSLQALVEAAHAEQQTLLQHQQTPLVDIQYRWSQIAGRHRLFDTLVVFQNFHAQAADAEDAQPPVLSEYKSGVTSTYPLTLSVEPAPTGWRFAMSYDRAYLSAESARAWLDAVGATMTRMGASPDEQVRSVMLDLPRAEATTSIDADSAAPSEFVAPRNDIEKKLVSMWMKELGLRRVSVHDNFFELGGHSVLALRIFAEIERELGCKIPLAVLANSPTIAGLSQHVDQHLSGQTPQVLFVPLVEEGHKAPLVLMPGAGGEALFWQHLDEWGHDRPVYTFGITSSKMPWSDTADLPQIADFYANAIAKQIDPDRGMHLAGYSFGGTLAFAVAHRLRTQGRKVGTVVILDSALDRVQPPAFPPSLERLPGFAENVRRWLIEEAQTFALERWQGRARKVANLALSKFGLAQPPENPVEDIYAAEELTTEHLGRIQTESKAAAEYLPEPYPGRLVLLRAHRQPLLSVTAWDFDWSKIVTGPVKVIEVPGNHETMVLSPHSRTLAHALQSAIEEDELKGD